MKEVNILRCSFDASGKQDVKDFVLNFNRNCVVKSCVSGQNMLLHIYYVVRGIYRDNIINMWSNRESF